MIVLQFVIICLLMALLYLAYQAHQTQYQHGGKPGVDAFTTVFERAITDAAEKNDEGERARLFALNETNTKLKWQQLDGERWLQVVAWMSDQSFRDYYQNLLNSQQPGTVPAGVNIWVTLPPQVQEFCRSLSYQDKSFRLKQFLGLDPNRAYEKFVELWVKADELFRPCPDPETSDTLCELSFDYDNPPKVKNVADYAVLYQSLIRNAYGPNGAPWTRLGYTYDWAYSRRNIGASEYIMVPGARYRVAKAYDTQDYCR